MHQAPKHLYSRVCYGELRSCWRGRRARPLLCQQLQQLWLPLGTTTHFQERSFCCLYLQQFTGTHLLSSADTLLHAPEVTWSFLLTPPLLLYHICPQPVVIWRQVWLPTVSCVCPDNQRLATYKQEESGVCKCGDLSHNPKRRQQVAGCLQL